jgi:hypothetical protein
MEPHGFDDLGGRTRDTDFRDFPLGAYSEPIEIPESYFSDMSNVPVYYQGKYPTCGGHAGATLASYHHKTALSPKYLWKQLKLIDGLPPSNGTSSRAILRSLEKTGDCTHDLLPNELPPSFEDYTDAAKLTDAQKYNGYTHDITGYAFHDYPTLKELKTIIYQNHTVLALMRCGTGWWTDRKGNTSWKKEDVLPLRLGDPVSGHFVVLYGYDREFIYFRNSWSISWGDNGNGYFGADYLPYVFEVASIVTIPAPFVFKNNLWFGQSNNDVVQLQNRLGVSPTSGFFGRLTYNAVVQYQKSHGITPTGFVGPLTRASLNKNA